MPSLKNLKVTNTGEGMEKSQLSYTIGGSVSCWGTMGKSMQFPQKTENRATIWSSSPTPGQISRQNFNSKIYRHTYVHSISIRNVHDLEET